jgi:serine/threonine-protein kinase
MKITDVFVLPRDVQLIAIDMLAEDRRRQLQTEDGDFVLTRAMGRSYSKVIDAEMAALVGAFTPGATIVDAVLQYCRARSCDPEETLDAAYPVLDELIQANFLAVEGSDEAAPVAASLSPGDSWKGLEVLCPVRVFEDSEVYQAKTGGGEVVALKKARPGPRMRRLARMLTREAKILESLHGDFTPALLDHGESDGCSFLVMEWCAGVSAARAAARLRAIHGKAGRRRLLNLCGAIADTYARLHGQQVIHGDVHPGNVLVDEDEQVTLIDFGVAVQPDSDDPTVARAGRAALGYFYEPECATAMVDPGAMAVPPSYAGEQHVLAHMIYQLISGHGYAEFSPAREASLRQLAQSEPEPFSRWGVPAWPDVERVLHRALSRDPADRYESVRNFAAALQTAKIPDLVPANTKRTAANRFTRGERLLADYLRRFDPAGALFEAGLPEPPHASINYGSGGVAYFLYRLACIGEDAHLLSWAKLWIEKAIQDGDTRGGSAFSNADGTVTPEIVGPVALYHSPTGLHAVRALIGHAVGDPRSQMDAVAGFVTAAQPPCDNIDVTLGTSGVLLGAALLDEAMPGRPELRSLGARLLADIWGRLDAMPRLTEEKRFRSTGIAHGWAGVLYTVLSWCRTTDAPLPATLPERLHQLADLAENTGDGLRWGQHIRSVWNRDPRDYSGGWCNGTAGMIHLWTRAHQMLNDPRLLDLAEGAARNVIAVPQSIPQLCCGLPGQAYAMLNLYKHTGERRWLNHAHIFAEQSCRYSPLPGNTQPPRLHYALYKGSLGTALLSADLEAPSEACMPLFESEGWKLSPSVSAGISGD